MWSLFGILLTHVFFMFPVFDMLLKYLKMFYISLSQCTQFWQSKINLCHLHCLSAFVSLRVQPPVETTMDSETTHPQHDDQHYEIADLSLVYFKVTVSLTCLGVAQGKHK